MGKLVVKGFMAVAVGVVDFNFFCVYLDLFLIFGFLGVLGTNRTYQDIDCLPYARFIFIQDVLKTRIVSQYFSFQAVTVYVSDCIKDFIGR